MVKIANSNRRAEFRTSTKIYKEGQKKIFVKMADGPEGSEFLKKIVKRENLAKKYFSGNVEVVAGEIKNNCIYYPFLDLPSLEELILADIKNGDTSYGASRIKYYIRFVKSLDSEECCPKQFIKELGIDSIPKKLNCLLFAPIDCVPANILVDKDKWYIIDLEWTFEFPLPVDFLIYRGIYSLVIHLQKQIQSNVSAFSPVTIFQGYWNNRTYIPCNWLDFLNNMDIPVPTLYYWEFLFQRKISSSATLGCLRLSRSFKKKTVMHDLSAIDYFVDLISRLIERQRKGTLPK